MKEGPGDRPGNIEIDLSRREARVGERLSGTVAWTPEGEVELKGSAVLLGWRTEGRGNTDRHVADELRVGAVHARPSAPLRIPFEFQVPRDGPISYDGKLFRVIWEVVVKIDRRRGKDETHAAVLTVLPGKGDS